MYPPSARAAPGDNEVLGESLSKLARPLWFPRSTLWTRRKALQRPGVQRSICALLRTNWDDDLDDCIVNPTAMDEAIAVERLVMLKYGIPDIRAFYQGDLRFLSQFSRPALPEAAVRG